MTDILPSVTISNIISLSDVKTKSTLINNKISCSFKASIK